MTKQTEVRMATPRDEAGIMKLCRMLHEENGAFPMSEAKVAATVHSGVTREPCALFVQPPTIGVIGPSDGIEGAYCFILSQMWYSDEWHLEELFSFVHPDHRQGDLPQARSQPGGAEQRVGCLTWNVSGEQRSRPSC